METVQTINEVGESSPPVEAMDFPSGLMETVGLSLPEKVVAEEEPKEEPQKEADPVRFDQHPRWKEVMAERDRNLERAIKAEATLEALKAAEKPVEKKEAEAVEADFKDIASIEDSEIYDWVDKDPKGFYANLLKQARHELRNEVLTELKQETSEKDYTARVEKSYKDYADKYPDFADKWNSGEIQKFMDDNPGHNAISAHQMMTGESRLQAERDKAAKEAEEKVLKNLKAKSHARTLESGPSGVSGTQSPGIPDELLNPGKYGGVEKVLMSRFLRRERGE